MRIPLPSILLACAVMAASVSASAEDFTGFYAGVNAGYAFERGGDRRSLSPAPPTRSGSAAESALPPSALSAAGSLAKRDGTRPGFTHPVSRTR